MIALPTVELCSEFRPNCINCYFHVLNKKAEAWVTFSILKVILFNIVVKAAAKGLVLSFEVRDIIWLLILICSEAEGGYRHEGLCGPNQKPCWYILVGTRVWRGYSEMSSHLTEMPRLTWGFTGKSWVIEDQDSVDINSRGQLPGFKSWFCYFLSWV